MSIQALLSEKTIKARHELLQTYLKKNSIGDLDEEETLYFKQLFSCYYTPDENDIKFGFDEITAVSIDIDKWGNKYFKIFVNETWHPTSIKRLAGGNRTNHSNLVRALRDSVQDQIDEFKILNPLNVSEICPISHEPLGCDAQVDHIIPFHILVKDWLKDFEKVVCSYDIVKQSYILDTSISKNWSDYHKKRASLRWLSKKGNRIAHTFYDSKH